jgi:hypothetical protein
MYLVDGNSVMAADNESYAITAATDVDAIPVAGLKVEFRFRLAPAKLAVWVAAVAAEGRTRITPSMALRMTSVAVDARCIVVTIPKRIVERSKSGSAPLRIDVTGRFLGEV